MKKIVSAVFVMCFAVHIFFAQSVDFDSVCKKLSEHPNMIGNFYQEKSINSVNRILKSNGIFSFSLEGIMWKTLKPFPSTLVVGLSSVIQTMPDGSKTVIDTSSNHVFTSISGTLSSMFSGNISSLGNDFKIDFTFSNSEWKAVLTPKDSSVTSVLKNITVSGSYTSEFAEMNQIILFESSGDSVKYSFTDKKYPKELTADERAYFSAQ